MIFQKLINLLSSKRSQFLKQAIEFKENTDGKLYDVVDNTFE